MRVGCEMTKTRNQCRIQQVRKKLLVCQILTVLILQWKLTKFIFTQKNFRI